MKTFNVGFTHEWKVFHGTERSQAAEMVIAPGGKEGGPGNKHPADQWLFVEEGEGEVRAAGKTVPLRRGALILIEKGEEHEVRNTGSEPLRTLNFYAPPASGPDDE